MAKSKIKPSTPGTRHRTPRSKTTLSTARPVRSLRLIAKKFSGRNNSGKITVRHQGGRQKRFFREIDFIRSKTVPAKVIAVEYDPLATVSNPVEREVLPLAVVLKPIAVE